jgi:uncharacterized membrane protein YphA (DoxX/SURF4 family)
MKKYFSNKYLLLIFRLFLGLIFIYSGYIKILDVSGFSNSIYNYKLFPDLSINFFAVVIPWIELVTGLLLGMGISVKENAFIINSLLLIFIIAITISIIRGLDINCGCFGSRTAARAGFAKLIENTALLFIGIILMIFDSKIFSLKMKN